MAKIVRRTIEEQIKATEERLKELREKKKKQASAKDKLITIKSEGVAEVIAAIEVARKANKVTRNEFLKRLLKITRSGIKYEE